MNERWALELTVEKVDGTVRHESYECEEKIDVARMVLTFKPKIGETLIHLDAKLVGNLF